MLERVSVIIDIFSEYLASRRSKSRRTPACKDLAHMFALRLLATTLHGYQIMFLQRTSAITKT
eukprot:3855494-Pyramimonas_sp.AAC.1